MEKVYEILRYYGLTAEKHRARLESWPHNQVIDFLIEMYEAMSMVHDRTGAAYAFIANGPMGGDSSRCSDPECRIQRVDHTARFATLYADRVLIPDPFEKFFGVDEVNERLIEEVSVAIQVLHLIQPTVEAGLIGFATGEYCLCEEHYKEHAAQADDIRIACSVLQDQFAGKVRVELRHSTVVKDAWDFFVSGPESLLEHGRIVYVLRKIPDNLANQLDSAGHYVLSMNEIKKFGFLHKLTEPILDDILLQSLYVTQGFHYLTDREIDLEVVAAVNDAVTQDNSSALLSGLSHAVPVVPEADLVALTKLRTNEGEAFRVYRDKLNSVTRSFSSETALTQKRVRQAFLDIIEPELNKLDQTVRDNKRLLFGQIRQDVIFGAGVVSIGLFCGLFSPTVGEIFAGLGGFKFVTGLFENKRLM